MSRPERPLPPPLEGNDRVITGTITSGFAVALIVLLIVRGQLPHADRWWVWVAAFGTFLGLFGFIWVPILKCQRDRASARRQTPRARPEEAGQATPDQDHGGREDADTGHADTGHVNQPGGARRP